MAYVEASCLEEEIKYCLFKLPTLMHTPYPLQWTCTLNAFNLYKHLKEKHYK